MKVRNGELVAAREPLGQLLSQKFPVKTSYGLAKMAMKLNEVLGPIDQSRDGLIRKYGSTGENGRVVVKQGDPKWEEFTKEYNELMDIETEIVFDKVALPDCEVEPSVLMALEKFITV